MIANAIGDEVEVLNIVKNLYGQEMRIAKQISTENIPSVCLKQ